MKRTFLILSFLTSFILVGTMAFADSHNNTNTNSNTNVNTNNNTNVSSSNSFAAAGASATGGNADASVGDINIVNKDHIQGPEIVSPDTKLTTLEESRFKTFGSVMHMMKTCSPEQADTLASDADDVSISTALVVSHDFINVGSIHIGNKTGYFMGYLYTDSDGPDVTAAGMEGAAIKEALSAGATGIVKAYTSKSGHATGSSWNIGIGGGASVLSNSGDTAVAPNGGTGFGKAWASNEFRPEMVFELYCNTNLLVKAPKYPVVSYDNTQLGP